MKTEVRKVRVSNKRKIIVVIVEKQNKFREKTGLKNKDS